MPAITRLGEVIDGKYRIVSLIGEGGMSAVYEALHLAVGRPVAVKIVHPSSIGDSEQAVDRLRREAKVVTAIGHPNICEVYDLGMTSDRFPYLVMERLLGETLGQRLHAIGPMPFMELAPIIKQVLAALDAAHAKGVVHRDLKPENIFIEQWRQGGRMACKLLDFGIATSMGSADFGEEQRMTQTGWVMGTPYYMAPEQARGDRTLDQRVDLWAVAVIIYLALTGRRPFVATNYNALLVKILTSQPREVQKLQPKTPDAVAAMLNRGLAKLREDRFQTAREFLRAIVDLERHCTAEDPAAPTLVMRGSRQRNVRPATRPGWRNRIDDPPSHVDDEATDIDAGVLRTHRHGHDHDSSQGQPQAKDAPAEAVFGVSPPRVVNRPGALDAESETRPFEIVGDGDPTKPADPRPRPAALTGATAEDTATTLVVNPKPRRQ